MTKILRINKCTECPYSSQHYISFEGSIEKRPIWWECNKEPDSFQAITNKTIGQLTQDNNGSRIPEIIPDWCPLDNEKDIC